jgi:hypothetical protein
MFFAVALGIVNLGKPAAQVDAVQQMGGAALREAGLGSKALCFGKAPLKGKRQCEKKYGKDSWTHGGEKPLFLVARSVAAVTKVHSLSASWKHELSRRLDTRVRHFYNLSFVPGHGKSPVVPKHG